MFLGFRGYNHNHFFDPLKKLENENQFSSKEFFKTLY
jgi:hypothetical protein